MAKTWFYFDDEESMQVYNTCMGCENLKKLFKPIPESDYSGGYETWDELVDEQVQMAHDGAEDCGWPKLDMALAIICNILEEEGHIERDLIDKALEEDGKNFK